MAERKESLDKTALIWYNIREVIIVEVFIGIFSGIMYVVCMLFVLAICVIVLIQELRKKEVKRIEASKADSSADGQEDESRHVVEER